MASQYHHGAQSYKLKSGQPPRSYGALQPTDGTLFNGLINSHPPCIRSAPPGPAFPPGAAPFQEPTPMVISRGLAICFAIMLLQAVLIICRSDTLGNFIDLKSAASRASNEKSALVAEREKSEREREKMRRDRELWEKVLEDRVPQGASWEVVWPAWDCRAYGKREYWGILRNIPEGWSAIDACMNMPVEINGVFIRRPYRCAFVDGSPHIHGYWMVDWNQLDCKPQYRNFHNAGCTSYRSGARRIEAQIVDIKRRKEQDWWLMCGSTPFTWNQINYTSPTHCEERRYGRKVAMWDVPDESCL